MQLELWYVVIAVALAGVVVWGFRASQWRTLAVLAALLLVVSGWLFFTLVLDETYVESDLNSRLDDVVLIGLPALAGIALGVLAFRRRA
ncbi:hypothetical protein JIG36_33570 [Actinoplanes sp. LDG1-06]|uniref:Uncharacterized protein n=1 Tax=Paractinoplanes ovalisporus TaxID=2810368 RepID=A0ABS2AMK1_9ACTN|nr:hypothetical protein [Actinoplanes ovalisporus]MBM2620451.1 hypothetical protein [Actinoplanes ovalisporus]